MPRQTDRRADWQRRRRLTLALLVPFIARSASACPLCDTDTGRLVREGVFGSDFWPTLAAVLAPFPALLLALLAIHFSPPRLWKRDAGALPWRSRKETT